MQKILKVIAVEPEELALLAKAKEEIRLAELAVETAHKAAEVVFKAVFDKYAPPKQGKRRGMNIKDGFAVFYDTGEWDGGL